ncbi:hypothetical protein GGQ05_003565 [Salinibacter ruber]|uniref:hypothetical protein n=1 Tax=Salinibacter ruber TaxID=146919 RepID=UPI00216A94C3|nr:hypothetical protein [Salinibacter ruber]MCS4172073.1 hypothetical protein [Salinibacter ruber]
MKQRKGTATPNRAQGVSAHASGDTLEAWGGIVSAHLEDWAAELDTTAEDVLGAVDSAGIDPITDTAEPKGRGKDRDRPTDPGLRCLALTTDDVQTLKNVLSQ